MADARASLDGTLVGGGVGARLRLGDFLELGAGARLLTTRGEPGDPDRRWHASRLYVAHGGFHAPITARFALPVGLDVAWGKDDQLDRDIDIAWGIRFTSASGRWYATVHPASPAWLRTGVGWRFTTSSGVSFGATL
jgi:hypothetical protein